MITLPDHHAPYGALVACAWRQRQSKPAQQKEVSSKIRELQIYEFNFIQLMMVLSRWKNEFEYVVHDNELLSFETVKLDVSHK